MTLPHPAFRTLATATLALVAIAAPAWSQTDYYNTDRGRPLRIEDASPVERLAWELQIAPLRLERHRAGAYSWGIEPEIAHGILPRTQVELGFPLVLGDGAATGLAGVELALLHSFNQETRTLPSLAVALELLAPAGNVGPDSPYGTAKGILTRTFPWARFHVNGEYTVGDALAAGDAEVEASRWAAGIAVDRALPLRALLLGGEVFVEQPIHVDEDLEVNVGTGVRYQLNPTIALDAGVGTRLTGDDRPWHVTFGAAYLFGVRSLFPAGRRRAASAASTSGAPR